MKAWLLVHLCSNGNLHASIRICRAWISFLFFLDGGGVGSILPKQNHVLNPCWSLTLKNYSFLHKWLKDLVEPLQSLHVMNRLEKSWVNIRIIDLSQRIKFWLKIRRANVNVWVSRAHLILVLLSLFYSCQATKVKYISWCSKTIIVDRA